MESKDKCPNCGSESIEWFEYAFNQIEGRFEYYGECQECDHPVHEHYTYSKSISYDD